MQLKWLETLNPRYFALTMATGIIAIALRLHEHQTLASLFNVVALTSWIVLFTLNLLRLFYFPQAVLENLKSPNTTFSFFTFVAASNVCGLILHSVDMPTLALIAWCIAFVYWSALMYFSFSVLCFSHPTRTPSIVDGGWLILIVGTQSLVLLGVTLAPDLGIFSAAMLVEATMLWCLGMMFYGILVTLLCYRIFFIKTDTSDFSPLFWVVMGASAISANAGSSLLLATTSTPMLSELRPVILLLAILWWTWATWWVPMLVIIGLWKHAYHRVPLSYTPALWNMVFPLGMYSVATKKLVLSTQFSPLLILSHTMLWVAVVTWFLVFGFFLKQLQKGS